MSRNLTMLEIISLDVVYHAKLQRFVQVLCRQGFKAAF